MRILFVAAGPPHPRLRGYQVRAYHQLRILSTRHEITLVYFNGATQFPERKEQVAAFCEEIITVPHHLMGMIIGVGGGVFSGRPLQTCLYETPEVRQLISRLLHEKRFDLVHVQLARMAGLLDETTSPPRVIDLVDALSLNMQRRRQYDHGLMRLAALLEAKRLRRYERIICRSWDHATVVSSVDRRAIGDFPNLTVNSSGVDLDEFPFHGGERDPYSIVFTGNLGYFSNIDSICWFVREIFPRIRREEPRAKLLIVGDRPPRKVRALARLDPQITVEGPVDRLHPYLMRSRLAIAPMRTGSGQLFKVLEAMACGTPLIATSLAINGIDAESERHVLVGDSPDAFARQALRLMREPVLARHIASEARRLVERRYGWQKSVAGLESIYHSTSERARGLVPKRLAAL